MSTALGVSAILEAPSAIEWQWTTTKECGSNSATLVKPGLGTVIEQRGKGVFGPLETELKDLRHVMQER